ncbi:MAG: sulfate reduction electron transfer complex DsrMKJOP subunit DsrM [Deltaproteobacteria bacterium]|nr:sulfate reduction electron transfer complex DsrMKJOP subunit DsrM [Deltaproteobacteria bacterium]
MKNLGISIIAVVILLMLPIGAAAAEWYSLLTVALPYGALTVFLLGFIYRVLLWAQSPVPFRITTTCGQEKSLPWIRTNSLESPSGLFGVIGRMALEILLFRSLFRNTGAEILEKRPVYGSAKWLWLFGLLLHWSLLFILLRHLRFFVEPIAPFINALSAFDGLFETGVPTLYLSDLVFLTAATALFLRRVVLVRVRYFSLPQDYFPLLLLLCTAGSGILMRHFTKVNLIKVKELATGWVSFSPVIQEGIGPLFSIHLFLVCTLLVWFPLSKLMHMGGIFLSPTRNLANDNRMRRHLNPWDAPVRVHTYEEYEDEFRDKMKTAGLPVERE